MFSGDDPTYREEIMPPRRSSAKQREQRYSSGAVILTTAFACAAASFGPEMACGATERIVASVQHGAQAGSAHGVPVKPERVGRLLGILLEQPQIDEAWERALDLLRESGADVEAMLVKGAENIEQYRHATQDDGGHEADEV